MKERCTNENSRVYQWYGGRGVKICDEWLKFDNFIADMGERPSKDHSIDRIDFNANYQPGNCRWVLKKQQQSNKSSNRFITYKGVTKTASELARDYGQKPMNVLHRLRKGWTVEEALTTPVGGKK